MTFAILGGISAAIAEGALAIGVPAAAAGTVGTIGTGALVGSGLGAATSAATGGDPGKGALFGALGGGLTGGVGSFLGSGSGAVGSIANAATPSVSGMFPAGAQGLGAMVSEAGLGAAPGSSVAGLFPAGASTLSSVAGGGLGSTLGSIGTEVAKSAIPTMAQMAMPSSGGMTPEMIQKGQAAQAWNNQREAKELGSQTWGLAGGGEVGLEDGDFIFPADVVSAIGNGSTKAGAQFLDEFFGTA